MNPYRDEADDFYINLNLNTELELPSTRETVLHFFEQMGKAFPELRNFYTRDDDDMVIEGDKEEGSYRWVALEAKRLCSGHVNPAEPEDAYRQHELVLDLAPHLLTISSLDCEAMDLMFGFDFNYEGNHDEIVAEALGMGQGLEAVLDASGGKVLNFEPSVTIALDPTCRLQARLSIETRTNAYQVRTGNFEDDQISVYFTVRQYWGHSAPKSFLESLNRQRALGEEIVATSVIPRIIRPMAQAIASR